MHAKQLSSSESELRSSAAQVNSWHAMDVNEVTFYMYIFAISCGRIKKWYVISMLFNINDLFSISDCTVKEH